MKKILLLILFLTITSCGSLPEDKSMSPVDAGLYLLEIRSSCGVDSGLHGCHYNSLTDLESKTLSFPVAFQGEYEIVSERCNLSIKQSFKGESFVTYKWSDLLKNKSPDAIACLFSLRVKIDGVRSIMGQFLLEDSQEFESVKANFMGRDYEGVVSYQLPNDSNLDNVLKIPDSAQIEYEGCGASGNKIGSEIGLKEMFPEKKSCLMAIAGINEKLSIGTFNLKFYDSKYSALPYPKISYNGKKLTIEADPIVGIVSINNKWKKSHKMSLSVKKGETAWIRLLTSNGRFLLLGIKDGGIVWKPSSK
ncbi:hypothetical protein MASR1M48_16390 [Lactococcus petauri]